MSRRYAIINADDFGQSPGMNRGIVQAHEKGILTSASLMVRWPAAEEAAEFARRNPRLGVGLHLDFGEWIFRDGAWTPLYTVIDQTDARAVAGEIKSQLESFERLAGRHPTHIDSHQHAHRKPPVSSILPQLVEHLNIPIRDVSIPYCGRFYGQDDQGVPYPECISVEGLIEILHSLASGATEIGCHPSAAADLDTMYSVERLTELATLCDPRVRSAVDDLGIELKSFADWRSYALAGS